MMNCYVKKKPKKVFFTCLLVLLTISYKCTSSKVLKYKILESSLESSTKSISKAISDVIHEFYISNHIIFNYIIYGETSNHINDVINEVKQRQEKQNQIPRKIRYIPDSNTWTLRLNQSAVIFIKSKSSLARLYEKPKRKTKQKQRFYDLEEPKSEPENFKFLIYVEDMKSIEQLNNSINNSMKYRPIFDKTDLTFFEYFICDNSNEIVLVANMLYTSQRCGRFGLEKLNTFSKRSQKWNQKLKNFDFFADFHGCMINFHQNIDKNFYIKGYRPHYEEIETESNKNYEFDGIIYELLKTSADKMNFSLHFSFYSINQREKGIKIQTKNFMATRWNTFRFFFDRLNRNMPNRYHSSPIAIINYYFLLSYNDLYTNYEKIFLPFCSVTWSLILLTFGLAFVTIVVLRFCPEWFRTLIHGKDIKRPGYNALGIFFGISQLKLPEETFNRSILLIFIWFCLIIRTCYQSMMFEFMTSDMRKPQPMSLEYLNELNYTILFKSTPDMIFLRELFNLDEYKREYIYPEEYKKLYERALDMETESKYAFFVSENYHAELNATYNRSLTIMHDQKFPKPLAFSSIQNNILLVEMNKIIDQLIPSGIFVYLAKRDEWFAYKHHDEEIEDTQRVLSLSDLEFGFVMFLAAALMSFLVFLCELYVLKFKIQLIKLLGLYEFLKFLNEILKSYHDKW